MSNQTYLDAFLLKGVLDATGNPLPVRKNVRILGATVGDNAALDSTDFTVPPAGTDGQAPLALGNGLNSNVALGAGVVQRLTGPTAAFSLGGFTAAGAPAQRLTIVNTTAQAMTIVHEDASTTTAAGRINCQANGANVPLLPKVGVAKFTYDATGARWLLDSVGVHRPLEFDVAFYGAKGDGATDDTAAIQAAYDAAFTTVNAIPNGIYQSGQLLAAEVIFSTQGAGIYKVSGEISIKGGIGTRARNYACLKATANTFSILRIAAANNNITGLAFFGGLHHITAYGASSHYGVALGSEQAAFPSRFKDCCFKYAAGPSFYIDNTPKSAGGSFTNGVANTAALFVFETPEIVGPCAYYGCSDGLVYLNPYCCYDQTTGAFDDAGNILAFFSSSDHITVIGGEGIPGDTVPRKGAWFGGSGIFRVEGFRFGGEAATVPMFRLRKLMPYNGMAAGLGWVNPSEVYVTKSETTGSGAVPWMEIFDEFPRVISIGTGIGTNPYGNISGGAEMVDTFGVWVDGNTVPIGSIINRDVRGLQIVLEGTKDINAFRFYTSTTPSSLDPVGFTDLSPMLRKHINSHLPPRVSAEPRNNLFLPGVVRGTDFTPNENSVNIPSNEALTGYTLNRFQATADGGNFSLTATASWNAAQAGEYTLSFALASSFGGRAVLGYQEPVGTGTFIVCGIRELDGSGRLERIGANFYHDGVAKTFFLAVSDMSTGSIVVPGLPAIHAGYAVHPYLFPVDNYNSPSWNTTAEQKATAVYYGSGGPPRAGAYIVGDQFVETAPGLDVPEKWVCVIAGSPGSWKAIPHRSGSASLPGGATSFTVTISPPEYDTNYRLAITPSGSTGGGFTAGSNRVEVVTKNTGSFIVFCEAAPPGGSSLQFDWLLYR